MFESQLSSNHQLQKRGHPPTRKLPHEPSIPEIKKKRGHPKKIPDPNEPVLPKRGRGRPRKLIPFREEDQVCY